MEAVHRPGNHADAVGAVLQQALRQIVGGGLVVVHHGGQGVAGAVGADEGELVVLRQQGDLVAVAADVDDPRHLLGQQGVQGLPDQGGVGGGIRHPVAEALEQPQVCQDIVIAHPVAAHGDAVDDLRGVEHREILR